MTNPYRPPEAVVKDQDRAHGSPLKAVTFGVLTDISVSGNPALAILAGIAFSFFAMTGFENTANVAEETIDPQRSFPRSLVGGMVVAGVIYVLVSMAAALTVPTDQLAGSGAKITRLAHGDDLFNLFGRDAHGLFLGGLDPNLARECSRIAANAGP